MARPDSDQGENFSSEAGSADDRLDLDQTAHCSCNVMVTAISSEVRLAWARAIHERARRRGGAFVRVHPLKDRRIGVADVVEGFARAAGGTLFIDDVERLSQAAQARLSSLLEEQSRRPVADRTGHRVRLVAGSSRPVHAHLATGTFSDALYYRLNVIHIDRMHPDDLEAAPLTTGHAFAPGGRSAMATTTRRNRRADAPAAPFTTPEGPLPAPAVAGEDHWMAAPHDQIAERAYQLYERRGREHGHDVEDWLEAEREMRLTMAAL